MLLVELRIFFSPFPEVIGFYKENTNIIMDQLIHLVLKCTEERMLHMYGSLQAKVHGTFSVRFLRRPMLLLRLEVVSDLVVKVLSG